MIDTFQGLHLGQRTRPLFMLAEQRLPSHPAYAEQRDWVVVGGPWCGGKGLTVSVDELITCRPYRKHCIYRLLRTQLVRAIAGAEHVSSADPTGPRGTSNPLKP